MRSLCKRVRVKSVPTRKLNILIPLRKSLCVRPGAVTGGSIARQAGGFRIPALGVLCFLLCVTASAAAGATPPTLSSDTAVATAGYYRLEWDWEDSPASAPASFEVQESTRADFRDAQPLYRGPDLATVISGRRDGSRYYRVRAASDNDAHSAWSKVVEVETAHHPLSRALAFFAAGALVFSLTLTLILRGSARH